LSFYWFDETKLHRHQTKSKKKQNARLAFPIEPDFFTTSTLHYGQFTQKNQKNNIKNHSK